MFGFTFYLLCVLGIGFSNIWTGKINNLNLKKERERLVFGGRIATVKYVFFFAKKILRKRTKKNNLEEFLEFLKCVRSLKYEGFFQLKKLKLWIYQKNKISIVYLSLILMFFFLHSIQKKEKGMRINILLLLYEKIKRNRITIICAIYFKRCFWIWFLKN